MPLRPCGVCRQPVPDGRCERHPPPAAYRYRPGRGSTRAERVMRALVLDRDGWQCAYCDGIAVTMDHILPRSRGGLTELDNLLACCRDCNLSKKDRTLREWITAGAAPAGAVRVLERLEA